MNRLEEHIKERLEARRMKPREVAWDKISGQLPPNQSASPRRRFWWVAAVAAVFILMGVLVNVWKEEPRIPQITKGKTMEADRVVPENEQVEVSAVEGHRGLEGTQKTLNEAPKEIPIVEHFVDDSTPMPIKVPEVMVGRPTPVAPVEESPELAIAHKLEEILAKVQVMEEVEEVSDAEIDSLLLAAQKELLLHKAFQKSSSIDAMALLNAVEVELYDEGENPLFNKLKENFFKMRSAVVTNKP